MPYLKARNTTATEIAETNRRVANLLNCLEREINPAVVEGDITTDLQRFRQTLRTKLEEEGWSFSYDGGTILKVRQPSHPRPFPRRTASQARTAQQENER